MRFIYVIQNTINGKRYVGQTKRPSVRRYQHWTSKNENLPLVRAMLKYGHDNFTFTIIEECEDEMSDERERHWIRDHRSIEYDFGYNLESGGNATKSLGEETRKRISVAQRAWHQTASPEEKQRWLDARAHVKFPDTPEFRKMISEMHKGKPKTISQRQNMRLAHLRTKHNEGCTCPEHDLVIKEFTHDEKQELQKRYVAGETAKSLANEQNVPVKMIQRMMHRAGIRKRQ